MLNELLFASGIVAVCVVIHIVGAVVLAEWLLDRRATFERRLGMTQFALLLILVFAVIILLHLSEAAIWAAFYEWRGLFPDYETALYFSLTSYSTIGYGDILLPQKWRLLGCLEGVSGVLLCGLSTAFLFVVVSAIFRMRVQQEQR